VRAGFFFVIFVGRFAPRSRRWLRASSGDKTSRAAQRASGPLAQAGTGIVRYEREQDSRA